MGDKKETKEKKKKQSFFKGLRKEFNKVTWPTKEESLKQTIAVVVISIILGALISVVDAGALKGVDFITTLK